MVRMVEVGPSQQAMPPSHAERSTARRTFGLDDSMCHGIARGSDPFMLHLYAALAEKERQLIGERTRTALAQRKTQGAQTVQDEKPLRGSNIASALASSLETRGVRATPVEIDLGGRTIAEALQDTALSEGAQLLSIAGAPSCSLIPRILAT